MRLNIFSPRPGVTHEGAPAAVLTAEQALRRSVLSCLLWEDEFYEDGEAIADRIAVLAGDLDPKVVAALAIEAREAMNLRHAPLMLLAALVRTGAGMPLVAETIARVMQRADDLTEFVALYWRHGKRPLSKQMKLGLARALAKFDAYQLAKYDREGPVKLRDVLFLIHAKPKDEAQAQLWKELAERTLASPDTWEVALSGGADKRETFTRLLAERKLGYLALLRNLRNMEQAGVDEDLVREAILARRGAERVLPFRFFAAAREAPRFEPELDRAMLDGLGEMPTLLGRTIIVLDVSGSMRARLSARSVMTRLDAGAALAAVLRAAGSDVAVYATAGNDLTRVHATKEVPARQGMALRDALVATLTELGGGGIFLKPMLEFIQARERRADRLIVITDEQDCAVDQRDSPLLAAPFGSVGNYLLNVASARNGIGYGKWTHIDGFSEAALSYICQAERSGEREPG
jgi:hypothetical protein